MIITGLIAGHDMVDGRCRECGRLWRDICDVTVESLGSIGTPSRMGWAHADPGTDSEARAIEEWRQKEREHYDTVFARS